MITLFPDQVEAKNQLLEAFAKGYKRPLLVAPTGWGKGTVAGDIIQGAVAKSNKVIFLVNRRELVKDMSKRLKRLGIFHGQLMGANSHGTHLPVLIASRDTLRNRLKDISAAKLVFVDEAHNFMSDKDKALLDTLEQNGAFIILMTATPWMLNGRGLEEIADCIIQSTQVAELIEQGRLAIPVIYAPEQPDMSAVGKTSAGEWEEEGSAEVMRSRKLIGDMVKHWRELASKRKTVGFAVNLETADRYCEAFKAAGINSVCVSADTPDKDRADTLGRDTIWAKLASGEIQVVWSVGIISYGWDVPEVDCLILARPTMSLALCLQQIGRGLRFCKGKTDCIILDHAGNTLRIYPGGSNGLPDTHRIWSLKKRKRAKSSDEELELDAMPQVCPACPRPSPVLAARDKGKCPVCGYQFVKRERSSPAEIEHDETGTLKLVESRVYIYPEATGDAVKDSAIEVAKEKGYDPRWLDYRNKAVDSAREKYRARFGSEPKEYWSAGQMNSMIKQADRDTV